MTHASSATGTLPVRRWSAPGHVDSAALGALLDSLGGDALSRSRFVDDFVMLWDERYRRLAMALARADAEDAHVTLLSIRSSSVMLGAVRLEAAAAGVHKMLKSGDLDGCRRQLAGLVEVGAITCEELAALYPRRALS